MHIDFRVSFHEITPKKPSRHLMWFEGDKGTYMVVVVIAGIELEWVNRISRDGRAGYYRRVPVTRRSPTIAQAEVRLRFSQVATRTAGVRGVQVVEDKRAIPVNASLIGEKLRGVKQPKIERTLREKIIELILK